MPSILPEFAKWYQGQKAAGWELLTDGYGVELADYGLVQWQGRSVEAVVSQITIKMKHGDLGKYEDTCFLVGLIADKEFARSREPILEDCKDSDARVIQWKTAHSFESRWYAQ